MWKAKDQATQRTKNRLREHDLVLKTHVISQILIKSSFVDCRLFMCNNCDWIGWLPKDEIQEEV